jgi:hypothetical protein
MDKKFFLFSVAGLVIVITGLVYLLTISAIDNKVDILNNKIDVLGMAAKRNKPDNEPGNVWQILKDKGLQGTHYTLNIHGKKDSFNKQDCTVKPDPITGEISYGNNIFIPSNGDSNDLNQILMQSGNIKGKWAKTADTSWGVRDTCTNPFDGDPAELVIPPSKNGYFVVARVLGKPTNNPELTMTGDLMWVYDEYGNDLLILGLVTDNGFETPSMTITRTKGKVKALDITPLLNWNGNVCYFNSTNYCYDDYGQPLGCTTTELCCVDSDTDGIYDNCTLAAYNLTTSTYYCEDPAYSYLTAECMEYNNEWVFNIGDLVGYMWDTFADGDFKLANIRFYPVP